MQHEGAVTERSSPNPNPNPNPRIQHEDAVTGHSLGHLFQSLLTAAGGGSCSTIIAADFSSKWLHWYACTTNDNVLRM